MDSDQIHYVIEAAELAYAKMQGTTTEQLLQQANDREIERQLVGLILLGEIDDNEKTHAKWYAMKQAAGWKWNEQYNYEQKADPRCAQLFSIPPEHRIRPRLIFQLTRLLGNLVTMRHG